MSEKKTIKFESIDEDTGEIIILEMDEKDFLDWEAYLDYESKQREARYAELRKLEHDNWKYDRND